MSHHPQTIQIFLPAGDPQGIRIAEITTRIVRVIDAHQKGRRQLKRVFVGTEAVKTGVTTSVPFAAQISARFASLSESCPP